MTSETDEQFVERMAALFPGQDRLVALARRGAAVQWSPIEEAPKDNGRVLLFIPPYGAGSGHWVGAGWLGHFVINREAEPTHFMPLPPPPAGEPRDGD